MMGGISLAIQGRAEHQAYGYKMDDIEIHLNRGKEITD